MVSFLVAAAIFGFAAVYLVPWVSGFLGGFVPANYKSYLPAAAAPALSMNTLIQAVVFGVILAAVLVLLSKAGIHKHLDGVEA